MMRGFINSSTIIGILLLILSVITLFFIKDKVQGLRHSISSMQDSILSEKENIHVLKAELAYLTKPQGIQKLNDQYLKLQASKQVVTMELVKTYDK
jgi:hypothetical protein